MHFLRSDFLRDRRADRQRSSSPSKAGVVPVYCRMSMRLLIAVFFALLLAACAGLPPESSRTASAQGNEVALFALGLIDTGYRFGGKNPEAGLDCSGMVSYLYAKAVGIRLVGSAADMARRGRPIARGAMRPGDLVFFNTRNTPASHVGVYIGDDRFVHAPSSNGRVRIERLSTPYFRERFEAARSYVD